MRTAFIASSREAKEKGTAELVAKALFELDFYPIGWWRTAKPGEFTLDQLRDLSDDVDAAILIWDADDTLWHRGKQYSMTRDNCLLEYGLFVSKLGRLRTGLLVKEQVKLPSDITGINVIKYRDRDPITPINELVRTLVKNTRPTYREVVPISVDGSIERKILRLETIPNNWGNRALYCRDEGAQNWLEVLNDPEYLLSSYAESDFALKSLRLEALKKLDCSPKDCNLIISFGPGDGRTEREVLQSLLFEYQCSFQWVPVDISHGLLTCAIHKLKKEISIPLAIQGDFEEGQAFIFEQIKEVAKEIEHVPYSPRLFTLLGSTFGNLDEREGQFIINLKGRLHQGDYLLFDFGIKGKDWSFEKDYRSQLENFPKTFIKFLCSGLAYRLGVLPDFLIKDFSDRIICSHLRGKRASDIKNTDTVCISDKDSQLNIIKFRRYSWEAILDWFENSIGGFKILFKENVMVQSEQDSDILGVGVVLLKKI